MQERGINSTFKKIIYESSEMVFLADDTFPYSIFYANDSFENQIGQDLQEKTLAGLGLDINAYIFKEELILTHDGKDYSFRLELPHENGSNYFLFYKGKEVRTHGLPSKKESQQFFKSGLDVIAIGQHDYLTYLNGTVLPVLGYEVEELLNTNLCNFIHPDDIERVRNIWKNNADQDTNAFFQTRLKTKQGEFKNLECSVQFTPDRFFIIARDITEKVKSTEIQERVELLALETPAEVKTGTWNFNRQSSILTFSPVSTQLLECPAILDLSKNPIENSNKEFVTKWLESFELVAAEKEEFDFSIQLKEEKEQWLKVKGIASGDHKFSGVIWDEYVIQEKTNKISLLEGLFQNSPEPGIIVYSDGKIFQVNEEAKNLFGLEQEKVNHLSELGVLFDNSDLWKDWIQFDDSDAHIQRFSSLLISAQGKQLTLEVSSKSISIASEKYISLVFRNITEKVTLEKTIEESSDFLMNLTEQVPGGLYQMVLDVEGKMKFSFLSKGISTVLGLKNEELDQFTDISAAITRVHPMDLPQVIMSSVASARKQEPWQCQFRVKTDDENNFRWVLGAARPQLLPNGDMVWYGYLTDISNQKEFEAKLDEARKTAEKASQIKSDFLSMISHELRTPLNAISGSVYSLLQEQPNDSQKTALNTINFAVDNLIIMINDLLDFQKIEAGKLTIEKAPFNFQGLVNQIIKGLSFHARDSKNNLNLHISEGLDIWLKGDKTRLSQILNNLITNALKFTNEGNVDVTVKLIDRKGEKAKVYFEVKDSGIGIAKENQEKIFNDFDQVKPTFSTKYGGTGLGLSITKKLLSLMGGAIQLESEEGKGSRFYFNLEFDLAEEQPISITPEKSKVFEPATLKLLMAEDNDVNALVLGKIIKKWGYTFDRVMNGQEAVEAVKSNHYDCILMDIQMPVMDGFDATVAIKSFSKSPVIALTAAAKLEIMERIDECGFDGFVAKPIDAAELLKKIKEVVSGENYSA
ncbi:ATP-binding protein [Algoriphagus pacificus]|uniref:histidine kinase n=1 Tax=Algoriphagus pacificus TaxID=2811234 RepID=A0ABS3CFC1_9BACT|nr:ATP-binding protein [Algoriphagus pacificus]MBN7815778.1 PAS domain S-box protein [Algoriphagus pacificus]